MPTPVTTEPIAEALEVKIDESETVTATVSSSQISEPIKLETDTPAEATVGETVPPAAVADSDAPALASGSHLPDTISETAPINVDIVTPVDAAETKSEPEELTKPVAATGVVETVAAAAVAGPLVAAAALAKPVAHETASPLTAAEKVTTAEKDTLPEPVTPAPTPAPLAAPPTILSSITGLRDCPAPALGLGTAGLLPFLAAPAIMVCTI